MSKTIMDAFARGSALNQCASGVLRVLLLSLALSAFLMPILWAINQLRNFGLPADLSSVAQTPLYAQPAKSFAAALIENYNSSMDGYSRFGSGLGMIAGAFCAMGAAKKYVGSARVCTGFTAGAIMGCRLAMMITSDPPFVIGGAVIGAVWTSIYLYLSGRPSRFKPLPQLHLCPHD